MRKIITILALAIVLYGCDEDSVSVADETNKTTEINEPIEINETEVPSHLNITVYRQNGESVNLNDHIGRPIVLNFWATWCPPCVVEMPHFSKLDAETDDILFFMINLTDGESETPEKVEKFLKDSGLTFKNILLDLDGEAMNAYKIHSIPMTVFIDGKGSIIDTKIGRLTEEQLREGIAGFNEK